MALYQYHCPTCQALFEQFVPVEKRDEVEVCPSGHPGVTRLFQSYAINQADQRKSFRHAMSKTPGKFFT
ncbi:MAG TPA: FmdB family zinc ribbon protein [Anaerolineae bacterium]|nr:FmdB family zinc ribbon protein [Anaerolineae bacterium]